jgi:hypothetical protein
MGQVIKYQCTECGHVFSEFGYKSFGNNFRVLTPGTFNPGGSGTPCCPKCKYLYFFSLIGYKEIILEEDYAQTNAH